MWQDRGRRPKTAGRVGVTVARSVVNSLRELLLTRKTISRMSLPPDAVSRATGS